MQRYSKHCHDNDAMIEPACLLEQHRTHCRSVPDVNISVMKLTVMCFWSSHES